MTPTFEVGQKVTVVGTRAPGEVISGPHKGASANRWLVRKADDNVALLAAAMLSPVDDKRQRVAGAICTVLYAGKGLSDLSAHARGQYLAAADAVLAELGIASDAERPLAKGDKIRILVKNLDYAAVAVGDILTVTDPDVYGHGRDKFTTDAPGRDRTAWYFRHSSEGTGWERA